MSRSPYGTRHPGLTAVLASLQPAAVQISQWGPLQLRMSAYLSARRVPEELVTSVRCLVEVDGQIVVAETPDDVSVWPGGRRESGETMRQTAQREVHEETGWRVEPGSLKLLGFVHLEHLVAPPADYPYPHPDFVQLIFRGTARDRSCENWRDVDGYVQRSWLLPRHEARQLALDPVSLPFLDALGNPQT